MEDMVEVCWRELLVAYMFGGGWPTVLFWLVVVGIPGLIGIAMILDYVEGGDPF